MLGRGLIDVGVSHDDISTPRNRLIGYPFLLPIAMTLAPLPRLARAIFLHPHLTIPLPSSQTPVTG